MSSVDFFVVVIFAWHFRNIRFFTWIIHSWWNIALSLDWYLIDKMKIQVIQFNYRSNANEIMLTEKYTRRMQFKLGICRDNVYIKIKWFRGKKYIVIDVNVATSYSYYFVSILLLSPFIPSRFPSPPSVFPLSPSLFPSNHVMYTHTHTHANTHTSKQPYSKRHGKQKH